MKDEYDDGTIDLLDTIGMHRRTDPHTSRKAAASILPKRFTIRQQVEDFAKEHSTQGFIDEQLEERFPHWAPSSWRTRRNELMQENRVLDSGRTRRNAAGREMIVWVHRDYHPSPPPIQERDTTPKQSRLARAEARLAEATELLARALPFVEAEADSIDGSNADRHFANRIRKFIEAN